MKLKRLKTSSFIFVIIILFLIANVIGYKLLYHYSVINHEKETKILFYEIQNETAILLTQLTYNYKKQKPKLLQKHKKVLDYLQTHQYDDSLKNIYTIINRNEHKSPYNIYITDKNLIIKNTTFPKDLGFDLSFAKEGFLNDKKAKRIGISTPIFEKSSKNFISYTNSYLPKEKHTRILQVSHSYTNIKQRLVVLEKTIKKYPTIKDVKVYLFTNSGFINDIILTDYDTYKPNIQEIRSRINEGKSIQNKLSNHTLKTENFIKDNIHYKAMYLTSKSPISKNTYIVYSIIFDESEQLNTLQNLNLIMFMITLLGIIAIFIVRKYAAKK